MSTCPFCNAPLSDADLQSGRCPVCGRPMAGNDRTVAEISNSGPQCPSDATDSRTSQTVGPGDPPTVEDPRLAATVDSTGISLAASQASETSSGEQPAGDTTKPSDADTDAGLTATVASDSSELGSSSKLGMEFWADEKIDETVASDEPSGEGLSEEERNAMTAGPATDQPPLPASEGEDRLAETLEAGSVRLPAESMDHDSDRLLAQTADSKRLGAGMAERMMNLWSGRFGSSATPRMSIKTDVRSIEAEAHLNIQPRVVCEAKDATLVQADYELLGRLGEGGMGVVREARQASMDRTVAVKMLKAGEGDPKATREKFLSEAVVTGELEHPNIVPIYDVGRDASGSLFYAMKRVKGTPWDTVIGKKTLRENVDILMKVADAVAFAHSKNVIHRDLKPDNVMLGDYGEVLLMDWGLAITLTGRTSADLGGTPAYMAPEMAKGPVEHIGFTSDVYLLGALLYEVTAGKTPHTGKNVMQCLFAAARNEIQPTDKTGELVDIARKAMSTKAEERFVSVAEFQNAIREYQSHAESILLSAKADEDLKHAIERGEYETFARALFGFQEAYRLWADNPRAQAGIEETVLAYAEAALARSDFDLGLSMLSEDKPQHVGLLRRLRNARHEREARQQRLKTARRVGTALAAVVFIVVTVAFFVVKAAQGEAVKQRQVAERNAAQAEKSAAEEKRSAAEALAQKTEADRQREKAEEQTKIANDKTKIAEEQTKIADQQRVKAEEQTKIANDKTKIAEEQTKIANDEKTKAEAAQREQEYEAYVAGIGAAAARIDDNAFDRAKELLARCAGHLRDWEWGRLMHLSSQGLKSFDMGNPVATIACSPDGKRIVTGGWNKNAKVWDVASGKELLTIPTGGDYVFAAAFSPDGMHVALGGDGTPTFVGIWDAQKGTLVRDLPGHRDSVLSLCFSRDGKRLLTGSYDNTARLWDVESGKSLKVFQGHEQEVRSVAFSPNEDRILTASEDGSVLVWSASSGERVSPMFLGHKGPVYAAVFSPEGKELIASGGYDRRVILWDPTKLKQIRFQPKQNDREPESDPAVVAVLSGHTAGVRAVQFSPNGKLLLSAANDNTVRVWNVESATLRKTLRGHAGQVSSCVLMPDGQHVLSGSHDHLAKIWDIAGYEESRVFQGQVIEGHHDAILGAAFSPDGRQILTASHDRTARAWDVATGKENRTYREGHAFSTLQARYFPDGKRILTAGIDNTVRIWDMATGTEIQTLVGTGSGAIAAVAISHDGTQVFTRSDDNSVKIWDARSGKLLRKLEGHRDPVTAVGVSFDDRLLASGDSAGHLRLWDPKSGSQRWDRKAHTRNFKAVAFHPDGKRVFSASDDNAIVPWDVATGNEDSSGRLKHPDMVGSMDISHDGKWILSTCADRAARLWDLTTGKEVRKFVVQGVALSAAAFSPDGKRAVLTGEDNTVRMWDVQTGEEIGGSGQGGPVVDLGQTGDQVREAVFSPDSKQLLIVGGNEARVWDVKEKHEVMRFSPHLAVASAQFSPDGKHIVTGSWDRTARIWNAQTGRGELRLDGGHTSHVNAAVYSPDGQRLATASEDNTACVWNAQTGKVLLTLKGHGGSVRSVVFSPDGSQVLTASNDKTARLWNAKTGQQIQVFKGHDQPLRCAAFSADGRRVVTASEDTTAQIWDAATGEKVGIRLQGHTGTVTWAAFSPGGRRVITGSADTTAKLWDAETGREILPLKAHTEEVTCVAFSPDGRQVLTASRDGKAIIWFTVDWRSSNDSKITSTPAAGH
jgi:WD40 repeat protein/tRNA A-37 threonylcarbamoyl transferase component Bud32